MEDTRKPASASERKRMGDLLDEALGSGCIGMSTGLSARNGYPHGHGERRRGVARRGIERQAARPSAETRDIASCHYPHLGSLRRCVA